MVAYLSQIELTSTYSASQRFVQREELPNLSDRSPSIEHSYGKSEFVERESSAICLYEYFRYSLSTVNSMESQAKQASFYPAA